MEFIIDDRVRDFARSLSEEDQGRILKHLDLFTQYGFRLPGKHLKKISPNLWELRPGNVRLLLGKDVSKDVIAIVHGFKKETGKTPRKEIETAKSRLR